MSEPDNIRWVHNLTAALFETVSVTVGTPDDDAYQEIVYKHCPTCQKSVVVRDAPWPTAENVRDKTLFCLACASKEEVLTSATQSKNGHPKSPLGRSDNFSRARESE